MSAEINRMNGGNPEIHRQQQPLKEETESNVVPTITSTMVKSIIAEETDFFPETTGTTNHPVGTSCPSSGSGCGGKKSKKRQNQKTYSLMDIFDMHKGIGSWADAAADIHTPSYSPSTVQESSEAEKASNVMQHASASQHGDLHQYLNTDGNLRRPPLSLDRATHSRNVDLANLPHRPPFEVKVSNINYKSSDNDLFCFFGGEGNVIPGVKLARSWFCISILAYNVRLEHRSRWFDSVVVNIRSEGQGTRRGTAVVSLASQESLVNALNLNGTELQGRSLRISLQDHQTRPPLLASSRISLQNHQPRPSFASSNVGPNNGYGHYRNSGGSQHEGGYSTLPHPRRGPPPLPYHSYGSEGRTTNLQHCSSYRGRDNRRYDYDSRLFRHPKPGSNQFSPRFANRSCDSYGVTPRPLPLNENHFVHHGVELEHDADRRGPARSRTESIRSNATDATEKHERRKLQLQPRTKPLSSNEEDMPARPTSIFGLAKPVDTYEKEKQVEERLRLENEAFKAAEQRSRKSSERAVSVPASPLLVHAQICGALETPSHDNHENSPPSIEEIVAKSSCESVRNDEKIRTTSVISQSVPNEEQLLEETNPQALAMTATSLAKPSPPPPELPLSATRRQSFSSYPEVSKTLPPAALFRTRNSYSRTFTRSRDSIRSQYTTNKIQTVPVRRGKSGSRRGGPVAAGLVSSREKHFVATRDKIGSSNTGPKIPNGPKQLENGPESEQPISKEEEHEFTVTSTTLATIAKQPWEQHSDQQYSKREKKKQAVAAREMPKYIEPKPFTFSSENKYAPLLDADE
uniref:RRM domain-containing protein n=1 Tax=Setaria digitata TaxID=48799 RepID=A0A915PSZ5_9BILA